MQDLEPPVERALELGWESFRAGSLGIGATVTRHGDVIATGRNRLAEQDPGDDVLAGTTLAHAETNALAKLPVGTEEAAPLDEAATALWDRLGAGVHDVERVAAGLPT